MILESKFSDYPLLRTFTKFFKALQRSFKIAWAKLFLLSKYSMEVWERISSEFNRFGPRPLSFQCIFIFCSNCCGVVEGIEISGNSSEIFFTWSFRDMRRRKAVLAIIRSKQSSYQMQWFWKKITSANRRKINSSMA